MVELKPEIKHPNMLDIAGLQFFLDSSPYNSWLGLQVSGLDEQGIDFHVPWREEMIGNPFAGVAHGGIISSLVDMFAVMALAAKLGTPVPTVDLRVDYHRAAAAKPMSGRGEVIKIGKIVCNAKAELFDHEGKLIASGRGAFRTDSGFARGSGELPDLPSAQKK